MQSDLWSRVFASFGGSLPALVVIVGSTPTSAIGRFKFWQELKPAIVPFTQSPLIELFSEQWRFSHLRYSIAYQATPHVRDSYRSLSHSAAVGGDGCEGANILVAPSLLGGGWGTVHFFDCTVSVSDRL